jgi:hypothetical protein
LTLLSASERFGQLFVLAIMLQTQKGCELLGGRFHNDFDERRIAAQQKFAGKDQLSDGGSDSSFSVSESSEEDIESEARKGYTNDEIRCFLEKLDLEYVNTEVDPSLDCHHRELLKDVFSTTLTARSMTGIEEIDFEPFLLDYRTVHIQENHNACSAAANAIDYIPVEFIPIEEGRESCSIKLSMDQFSYLVESILSFEAFIKYGTSLLLLDGGIAGYKRSLACLRKVIVETISRGEGTNEWFLQKFLEMGHFLLDLIDHGSASGFSTSPFERALKVWAKRPAATAQKRSDEVFTGQVCARLHEFQLIEEVANSQIKSTENQPADSSENSGIHLTGANFQIFVTSGVLKIRRVLSSGREHPIPTDFPEEIVQWYGAQYTSNVGQEDWQGYNLFTEISIMDRDTKSRTLLRAHPHFQSAGAWYDFAFVTYYVEGSEEPSTYPCRIVSLYVALNDNTQMALIQEVEFQTPVQQAKSSQLFEHWRLRNRRNNETGEYVAVFTAIPVESITDRIYAIDTVPDGWYRRPYPESFDIVVVKYQKEEWPKSFLESPKYLDPNIE